MTSGWRHARAAFFAFHAIAVLVLAIPAPPPGLRGGRKNTDTEAAIERWGDAAEELGLDRSTFEDAVRGVTAVQGQVVPVAQAPLRPYADLVGARQSWLMFGTVPEKVARFEIDVRTERGWEHLYVARSDEATWRRALFDQERMRTFVHAFARRTNQKAWDPFVDWVAREAFADRPDALVVRVQLRRLFVPPPETLRATGALREGEAFWTAQRGRTP